MKLSAVRRVLPDLSNWRLRTRLILASVLLAAVAISASDFAARTALRSYLIDQIDRQLTFIAQENLMRLDRAGIEASNESQADDRSAFQVLRPVRGLPNAISLSLLDVDGNLIGRLGGDLNQKQVSVSGMPLTDVQKQGNQPFTIEGGRNQPDVRAIAQALPTGLGSVIVASSLEDVDRTTARLSFFFFILGALALLLIALSGRWLIAAALKPLDKVETTAEAITSGDFSARLPVTKTNTEVGRLTTVLNKMLARIEESFAARVASENKLRRFAADASHELRTPLTAIRGFAELYRQGAITGEEKTRELISRIEKESVRMSALVEDLLLLARLDQSRELENKPVELGAIVKEATASAKAAGPDHIFELSVPSEEIYVLGDSRRIHQVVANLLANARTHTPAGTKIKTTLSQDLNETTLAVSDNGPGLSKADQEKIFERFFRADPSRARTGGVVNQEGTGLGLSIVDAVMNALGGKVTVDSELGRGATFTLHFPIKN